ncbi:MAG: hypothetical protein J5J06_11615 [Phycisphaerae bacterium]|nr:hypothetical protein [Phycisphaerae bacterium]
MSEEQLSWVQRNRARRRRTTTVGERVLSLAWGLDGEADTALQQVADYLAPHTDEPFREQCRLAAIRSGVLVINVAEHGQVFGIRAQWRSRLESVLRVAHGMPAIRQVHFAWGDHGVQLHIIPASGLDDRSAGR